MAIPCKMAGEGGKRAFTSFKISTTFKRLLKPTKHRQLLRERGGRVVCQRRGGGVTRHDGGSRHVAPRGTQRALLPQHTPSAAHSDSTRGCIPRDPHRCQRRPSFNTVKTLTTFKRDGNSLLTAYWSESSRLRAEDVQGTPNQSHISPSLLVYEDKNT